MLVLTREQSREIDRRAMEELGIPGVVLMENAGRSFAAMVLKDLTERGIAVADAKVAVLAGGGNNGGDGYVIARHMHNAGAAITIHAAKPPDELDGDAGVNAHIAQRMKLKIHSLAEPAKLQQAKSQWQVADVIVDALLGTGFQGSLRKDAFAIIKALNDAASRGGARVFAVDVPSGLDCDTGRPGDASGLAVKAHATMTFVAMKTGLAQPHARQFTGEVRVGDIGLPPDWLAEIGATL